jgi:DNA-binding transcriptional LysR family regulator
MEEAQIPALDLIEAFLAAARSRTFLEASVRLNTSPASFSEKIKKFEKLMAVPVFSYRGRKKVLTIYGQDLYRNLKGHFENAEKTLVSINQKYLSEENLKIRVGGRSEICATFIKDFKFRGTFKVHNCPAPHAYKMLLNQELDVALGYEKIDSSEIMAKKTFSSSCRLIISKKLFAGHSQKTLPTKDFLRNTSFLAYRVDGPIYRNLVSYLKDGSNIKTRVECDDWLGLIKLVEEGLGYSVIPDYIPTNGEIYSVPLSEEFFPSLQYYAFFAKDLMKVRSFANAIRWSSFN